MNKKIQQSKKEAKKYKGITFRSNAFSYRVYYNENGKQKIFFSEDGFQKASYAYLRKEKIEEIKKVSSQKGYDLEKIKVKIRNGIDLDKLLIDLKTNIIFQEDKSLIEVFDEWFNIYVEQKPISQQTKDKRWQNHNRIFNYWQNTNIKDITIPDYQKFINFLGQSIELGTLQRLNSAIKQSISTIAIPKNYLLPHEDFTVGIQMNSKKEKEKKLRTIILNLRIIKKL